MQQVPDIADELQQQRVVEPMDRAELVAHLLRGIDWQEKRRRIPGQARKKEDEHHEPDQRDQTGKRPLPDKPSQL
jgi:hypothetical protein